MEAHTSQMVVAVPEAAAATPAHAAAGSRGGGTSASGSMNEFATADLQRYVMKVSITATFLPVPVSTSGGLAVAGGPAGIGELTNCAEIPPAAGSSAAEIADRQQTAEVGY